jgi:hypothetical protein
MQYWVFTENVEIYWCACVSVWLDKTISRKGLNACQAAFSNRKYKAHRRVGLPSDIIDSLATKDTVKPL